MRILSGFVLNSAETRLQQPYAHLLIATTRTLLDITISNPLYSNLQNDWFDFWPLVSTQGVARFLSLGIGGRGHSGLDTWRSRIADLRLLNVKVPASKSSLKPS